jgi:esterase/lipase superfamily enzyme
MIRKIGLVLSIAIISACASTYPVAEPPNLRGNFAKAIPISAAAPGMAETDLIYVTDRGSGPDTDLYGSGRSNSMAFGHVEVGVTNMTTASFFSYMSGRPEGAAKPAYAIARISEAGRFPATPLPFALKNGVVTRDRPATLEYQAAAEQFKSELTERLKSQGTGKVILYIHGFKNSFAHSAYNLLELWAAADRDGVPVLFSWPTGEESLFGYLGDTQNGAFSVYHLKELLRLIASTDAVDEVVVIAHSHGASIATTALRELLIEARGAGLSMRDTYRIETLILAAPDIDLGVMEQRLVAEMFGVGFGQIDVYMNPHDNALGLAGMLFGAPRFGNSRPGQLSPQSRAVFRGVRSVHFILVEDAQGEARHNHFRMHPGVLADIATTIRTGAEPGDPERPLAHLDLNFWQIDRSYFPFPAQDGATGPVDQ